MMRRSLRLWSLVWAPVVALSSCLWVAPAAHARTLVVFSYTGSAQTWVVPEGVTAVQVSMVGAGGGGGRATSTATGGGGGFVTGTLTVVPGDTLTVIVGQGGINDGVPNARDNNYRFGGGASGAGNPFFADSWASGGGRTALRSAASLYATAGDLLTAGAGGGGGFTGAGGAGGGSVGLAGEDGPAGTGGGGGTQTAGGAAGGSGGGNEPGTPGIQYAGGYAQRAGGGTGNSEGGGGGGGYFGGGGAGDNGGGGGGSSFLGAPSYFSGSTTSGSGAAPGSTSWPTACGASPGRGAQPGSSASVGVAGHGCVVIDEVPTSPDAPPPWLQAYGRPEAASECTQGWNPSWAEWPGDRAGGFTCERRLQYVGGTWVYFAGFPD